MKRLAAGLALALTFTFAAAPAHAQLPPPSLQQVINTALDAISPEMKSKPIKLEARLYEKGERPGITLRSADVAPPFVPPKLEEHRYWAVTVGYKGFGVIKIVDADTGQLIL